MRTRTTRTVGVDFIFDRILPEVQRQLTSRHEKKLIEKSSKTLESDSHRVPAGDQHVEKESSKQQPPNPKICEFNFFFYSFSRACMWERRAPLTFKTECQVRRRIWISRLDSKAARGILLGF
jgi:hypothetical protein